MDECLVFFLDALCDCIMVVATDLATGIYTYHRLALDFAVAQFLLLLLVNVLRV